MRRLLTTLVLAALVVAGTLAGPIGSADAAGPRYVALGDSYSAGTGSVAAAPFLDQLCYRTEAGHPFAHLSVDKANYVACSGATTFTMAPQIAAAAGADRVTLTIGGNDLQFVTVIASCLRYPGGPTGNCSDNKALTGQVAAALKGQAARTRAVLTGIDAVADGAQVYLAGYPQFFGDFTGTCRVGVVPTDSGPLPVHVSKKDALWMNSVVRELNKQQRIAVRGAKAAGTDARFVNADAQFAGHRLCDAASPYLNGLVNLDYALMGSFHPNAAGERAYADAYLARGFVPVS